MDYLIYEKYHHRTYEETNDRPIKKKNNFSLLFINWVTSMFRGLYSPAALFCLC